MNWEGDNIAETFKLFKQRMTLILTDENVIDPAKQAIKIQIAVGNEGLKRLNASMLSDTDKQDPAKLYKLFEDQLDIRVNFRIHRMELMTFRQTERESTDEFVNRARHKGSLCDFDECELVERVIELIIASTPHELLQKHLLDQNKGYDMRSVLQEARKYEAIVAGKASLQTLSTHHTSISEVKHRNACRNCALSHAPRQCPAYKDRCKHCDGIGHWAKCCRKKQKDEQQRYRKRRDSQPKSRSRRDSRRRPDKPIHELSGYQTENENPDYESESEGEVYTKSFSTMTTENPGRCTDSPRDEVYAQLNIVCADMKGVHELKLKVDTGASGNTLPIRIARQMYGDQWTTKVEPVPNTTLTAYNGGEIKCCGAMKILCQYKECQWRKYKFYVVDVDGPAILGLRACEQMKIVTINAVKSRDKTTQHAVTGEVRG